MELIEVIENIVENSDELEKLLELKKFDEMYQLLKENGYEKGPEILKKDVEELTKEGLMNLENIKLSKVSGGRLKENINKATSLGMASLLMLGASPMGPKANATGFRSNGVKAPVSASTPVNSNKEQGSPKKSLVIPSRKGNNIIKAIGAVAAVAGVGALGGYGARTLQDKIFKPEQEPKPEPKVETVREIVTNTGTVIVEKEKLIDYGEFIEKHVGRCDEFDRTKRKACAECIRKINNILGFKDTNSLQSLTYEGYDISRGMYADNIGSFLCHAVTGYACGDSAESMKKFQDRNFLCSLQNLVVFGAFAKEFQDSGKHEKIKQCIECLMSWYEKIGNNNYNKKEFPELINILKFLPKFSKSENLHGCVDFYKWFDSIGNVCGFVVKLYNELEKKSINDDNIESIKMVYENEECTLDDAIAKEASFYGGRIEKVIVKRTDSTTNTFAWNNDGTLTPEDDAAQLIQE